MKVIETIGKMNINILLPNEKYSSVNRTAAVRRIFKGEMFLAPIHFSG